MSGIKRTELLLYLDILAYFPEFARNGCRSVGEFIDEYLACAPNDRPTTMFSGYRSDVETGVVRLIEFLQEIPYIRNLRIIADSSGTDKYTAVCLADGEQNIYFIMGANYRDGSYLSYHGRTSTWSDNFLGAVQSDTAEQKSILRFYDKALSKVKAVYPDVKLRITVSGHSKAGNLAQYITVLRDSVDRCFSFDGQGFSEKFLKKYRAQTVKNASKIISICPDMCMTGSLLNAVPGAKKVFIKTGYLTDKNIPLMPLFCHIPTALLNAGFRLKPCTNGTNCISDLFHAVSVLSVKAAGKLPFVNAGKGLSDIGSGVRHLFKGENRKGIRYLTHKDPLALLLIGGIIGLTAAPVCIASEALRTLLLTSERA